MLKIKALAVAAALVVSGTAFAKVGSTTETTTGGEMFLSLFSKTSQVSYIFDTGLLYSAFDANYQTATPTTHVFTLNAATDVAFSSFLSLTNGAADLGFSFMGGDNSGVPADSRHLITTIANGADVTLVKNGSIQNGMDRLNANYLGGSGGVSSKLGGTMAVNGSAVFEAAFGNGYYFKGSTDTLTGSMPISNANGIALTADLYRFVRSSTSSLGDAIELKVGTVQIAQLSPTQWTATVSAVPEPSSYAMALVALAMAGVASRRRAK